jgi:ubiquinone/menaquinone biosynthesis C-methylase UbiE
MNFDRVAGMYRSLERLAFGGDLQRSRVAHLDSLCGAPRVLVLGDGDGRFLEALIERVPEAEIEVVEASPKMITLARQRVASGPKVVFHERRIEEFEPDGSYDLVACHFFLDCFDPEGIEGVVKAVGGCLVEGGAWLISDFQIPKGGVLRRARARILLWVMYRFFGLAAGLKCRCLVDPAPVLERAGFVLERRVISNLGLLRADRWVSG